MKIQTVLNYVTRVAIVSIAWFMSGCSTAPSELSTQTERREIYPCRVVWKGLVDSRLNQDSLGRIEGNQVLYPYLSDEINRRISEVIGSYEASPADLRNGLRVVSVWGELMRAQVRDSISQLEMGMTFTIHREGETEPFLDITTSVKRGIVTPEDRLGVRFIGVAIDEAMDQLALALQQGCSK